MFNFRRKNKDFRCQQKEEDELQRHLKDIQHWKDSSSKRFERPEMDSFKASEGWKLSYGIKEKKISGESSDVSTITIESWMERVQELCKDEDKNILNMDESGWFFKALPTKGLAIKGKKSKAKVEKILNKEQLLLFLLAQTEEKSENLSLFGKVKHRDATRLIKIMYFSDNKSWMQVEIMEKILEDLNREMKKRGKKSNFVSEQCYCPSSYTDRQVQQHKNCIYTKEYHIPFATSRRWNHSKF